MVFMVGQGTCGSLLQPMLEQHTDMVPGLSQLGEVLASCWVHVGTVGGPWYPVFETD